MGFVLESFDPLGRFRTHELVYGRDGQLIAEHPVDTAVKPFIDSPADPEVSSWSEMAVAIANSSRGPGCLVQRWAEYSAQRPMAAGDSCEMRSAYELLMQNKGVGGIPALMEGLATSGMFRTLRKD